MRDLEELAHHLQSPLAAISLELCLIEDMHPAELERNLHRISNHVAILGRIASELADVVALARGQLVLDRRTTELRSLIVEILDQTLGRRDRARCVVESPRACLAWIDAPRIERVLLSLVETALRASSRDAAVLIDLEQANGVAVLSVIDAGKGMSLHEARGAFDRSETGIGMYTARCIVEAHGGTVSCTSEPGIGSRYTAEIPLAERDDRVRVLIVDADARHLAELVIVLRREGLDVSTATCGSSALCMARAVAPDIAVIAVELPDVSARELAEQLRDGCPWLPIIVASEQSCEHPQVVDALAASHGKFLARPLDVCRLLDEIVRCTQPSEAI
jgi:two-component system, sensor histidine kinase and response regulator